VLVNLELDGVPLQLELFGDGPLLALLECNPGIQTCTERVAKVSYSDSRL
jgi:hypothetical protein